MVEGHFFPMQQHLHSQSGSSRSCDVLEHACRLVVQIAKAGMGLISSWHPHGIPMASHGIPEDPKGGDSMILEEIQCVSSCLSLAA